jgi:hypothetical protein
MHATKLITPAVFFFICVGLVIFVFAYRAIFHKKKR